MPEINIPYVQRPKSGLEYRRKVPLDLIERLGGRTEVKLGLAQVVGDDVVLAGLIARAITAFLDNEWATIRRVNFKPRPPEEQLLDVMRQAEAAYLDLLPRLREQLDGGGEPRSVGRIVGQK